jgi:hypothetical protein
VGACQRTYVGNEVRSRLSQIRETRSAGVAAEVAQELLLLTTCRYGAQCESQRELAFARAQELRGFRDSLCPRAVAPPTCSWFGADQVVRIEV